MSRTLSERWREDPGIQTGEAIGHALVACAPIAILAGFRSWGFDSWEVAGGASAMVPWIILRELIDQWPIQSWGDTVLDSLEMIVGGALGGWVLRAVV